MWVLKINKPFFLDKDTLDTQCLIREQAIDPEMKFNMYAKLAIL